MKDIIVLVALLLSFGTLVTTHVAIVGRMVWRVRPWYRGLMAVVVPPLAPWWAYEQRWRTMVGLWGGSLLAYAVFLVIAAF